MIDRLRRIVTSDAFGRFITTVIIVNAITLGLQTSEQLTARWGEALHGLDQVALAIFTAEILLRLAVIPRQSLRDPWFWFDFSVVAICYLPTAGPLSVLRTLRLFRVLRLISVVPSLRQTVQSLLGALPGMGSVVLLLGLIFYVGAVIATEVFGDAFPAYFGTLGRSLYSLFQIMTLESWSNGIVRPILKEFPLAWTFFVPFIVITSFAVLNMFIGVIVSSIEADSEDHRREHMAALEARLMQRLQDMETRLMTQQSADRPAIEQDENIA
ncbi:MAG: voltage-gated sodium channel [Xanthomonadales bacterium]|jgi:voltage-gated sodium channel|nr:voltage-gated sodium channel [Xanthomonadales bacterium]